MAYRLWTNDDLTPDKFSLLHLIKNARSYAQAADIMRLEILARHGGVYLDTDFECFQPMEPILAAADSWDVGLVIAHEEPRTYEYVSNGMVMARPGHHAIASCLKHLHDHGVDLNTGENKTTGPGLFGKYARAFDYLELPTHVWYPYLYTEKIHVDDAIRAKWKQNGSMGAHHWEASWWSQ